MIDEIYNFLKRNQDKWFSTKEIKEKLGYHNSFNGLNKLYKQGYVLKKYVRREEDIKIKMCSWTFK